jgi:hypothetical protein
MPMWMVVAFWVVVVALAVGAYVERRRGRRRVVVERRHGSDHAEFEDRGRMRGHDGHLGG